MDRRWVKKELKRSCRGVLQEYMTDVGFNKVESVIFKHRYMDVDEKSIAYSCLFLHISPSTYNSIHNNILDKLLSYFNHRK